MITPASSLITYPSRPRQGGPLPIALTVGAYRCHFADVSVEPKLNGWRAMVHTPSGCMYNRHGELLTISRDFEPALARICTLPFEWLDCEALERRHNIARGTLIVLDWIVQGPLSYRQRRAFLEATIHEAVVGMEEAMHRDDVRLVPQYDINLAEAVWERLQEANRSLGCIFYEGVVTKRSDSEYPIQLRSPSEECTSWVKHRFTTK